MNPALVLVLFVAAGELESPWTTAMKETLERSLVTGAKLELRTVENPESQEAGIALGRAASEFPAVALVERFVVTPTAPAPTPAATTSKNPRAPTSTVASASGRIAVWDSRAGRPQRHELVFAQADSESGQGRALGFAVLTMFPELAAATAQKQESAPPLERTRTPTTQESNKPTWSADIELLGVGNVGISPSELLGGGGVGARVCRDSVGVCGLAQLSGRAGSLTEADAAWTRLRAWVGAEKAWGRWSLGAGAGADRELLRRRPSGQRLDRWNASARVHAGVSGRVSQRVALFARVGPEYTFGATDIVVNDVRTAGLPRFSLSGDAGVRFSFD